MVSIPFECFNFKKITHEVADYDADCYGKAYNFMEKLWHYPQRFRVIHKRVHIHVDTNAITTSNTHRYKRKHSE